MKVLLVLAVAFVGLSAAKPHRQQLKALPFQFPGQCKVCTDTVDIMEILLKDFGPAEATIKNAAEELCAKLPYFADQCKSLVDTVINYIDQNEDPDNICKLITACPEPQPKLKALPIQFPGQCKVCNDAVDIMEILLKDFGPAEATIKNAAEELCAKLPYFADQCKSLVNTVINYIDQNEDPENICKLITACPEPQPKLKALPIQFPGQCKVCNDAVDIMEILLKDYGPAEATIKNAAEELCAKLPYFADQCKSLVDTVINYIDQNEDPENICKLITACPEPQPKLKALPIQFPGQCKVCNDAVDIMEILLKDFGPAEATIKNAAEELCAKLPYFADQCKTVVDTVINYIDQNEDPDTICSLITACPEPQQ